jgi:hypothetical protein
VGPTQPPFEGVPDVLSLGIKQPGHEVDLSPPASAKVKKDHAILLLTLYAFMTWARTALPYFLPLS